MNRKEFKKILNEHLKWLKDSSTGKRANLSGADLSGANLRLVNLSYADLRLANLSRVNLSGANLSGANVSGANLRLVNLSGADLSRVNLSYANLSGANVTGANLRLADLSGANLSRVNLSGANLSGASVTGVNLSGADLSYANLSGANLSYADLSGADLSGANLPNYSIIPEKRTIICYKKLKDDIIAELEVPAKAKRINSLVGRKCRAEYVKVLSMENSKGDKCKEAYDMHSGTVLYKVGKVIKADKWNDDIRIECTNGIHFFITKKEAEEYV